MVWHHRRATVKAYLKQQRGYGEAEGLLKRKHPDKFRGFRADLSWMGRIYTRAGLGLEVGQPLVHHGVFGTGMFQTIYAAPQVWWPLLFHSLEWWLVALSLLLLAPVYNPATWLVGGASALANPLLLLPLAMIATTLGVAWMVAGQASPPVRQRRWWSRPLIAAMHVAQPVERGWARYKTRFETIQIPEAFHDLRAAWQRRAGRLLGRRQVALWSENGVAREKLLEGLLQVTAENRWFVRIDPGWATHDIRFYGDRWCKTDLVTVTENHGGGRRLTRVRLRPAPTLFQKALWIALAYLIAMAWGIYPPAAAVLSPLVAGPLLWMWLSGRRLNAVVMASVLMVARRLDMTVVGEPDALDADEEDESALPVPADVAARLATAMAISPLVRRAAGL